MKLMAFGWRQRAGMPASETMSQPDPQQADQTLRQSLGCIAAGRFSEVAEGPAADLARTLDAQAHDRLERTVRLSIEASEAVIAAARSRQSAQTVSTQISGVAASAEELAAAVEQIAASSQQALAAAGAVESLAVHSDGAVGEAMTRIAGRIDIALSRIESLSEASARIGEILRAISAVSRQTRLLALNATIEAAAAGEAGKGFAVVAGEVKDLAAQTASLTASIAENVERIQQGIAGAVAAITDSAQAVAQGRTAIENNSREMHAIESQVQTVRLVMAEVAGAVAQQAQASQEISERACVIAGAAETTAQATVQAVTAMDRVESLVRGQLEEFKSLSDGHAVIQLAKSDHVLWKKRLAQMLTGHAGLDDRELCDHHACRLGLWYDRVKDPAFLDNPAFTLLAEPHARVHRHGKAAARLFNQGLEEQAFAEMDRMIEASSQVLDYLDRLG